MCPPWTKRIRAAPGSFAAERVQRVANLGRPPLDLPVTKQMWLASPQYSLWGYLIKNHPFCSLGVFLIRKKGWAFRLAAVFFQLDALDAHLTREKAKRFAKMGPVANQQEPFVFRIVTATDCFAEKVQLV